MKCPNCNKKMEDVIVEVEGSPSKVLSHQCDCGYFEFDKKTSDLVVADLKRKEMALRLKQKVIKLSKGRLGLYFGKDIVKSLDLKAGEEVDVTVPDKKHIVIRLL